MKKIRMTMMCKDEEEDEAGTKGQHLGGGEDGVGTEEQHSGGGDGGYGGAAGGRRR